MNDEVIKMSELTEIEIILNSEELDWLDNGNGFCSLDDLPRKDYNDISRDVKEKLRVSYTKEAELKDEYRIKLTKKEIDCIQEILTDFICDDYHFWNEPNIEIKIKIIKMEQINGFIVMNNKIFKKLGIPILTIDFIKNKLEYQ